MGTQQIAHLPKRQAEVILPVSVLGIGFGESFDCRQRGLMSRESVRASALGFEHIADLAWRDGKAALPSGVFGVSLGEAFINI